MLIAEAKGYTICTDNYIIVATIKRAVIKYVNVLIVIFCYREKEMKQSIVRA